MAEKKKVTANEIYDLLVNEFKIKEQIGSVEIILGGISAKYEGKDAIGDLLQEWLGEWLKQNNIYYREPSNSQAFPDFLLNEDDKSGFLELKTFNSKAGAAFDVANFDSYFSSLMIIPERIDADYLIFSYKMTGSELYIKDVWLRKVWQITSKSKPNPLKLQTKKKQPYNIRPCSWYAKKPKFPHFEKKIDFIEAISLTNEKYNTRDNYNSEWKDIVKAKYLENTGVNIEHEL
jgi:type II restriction enzyme